MDGQRVKKIVTDPSTNTTKTTEYFYNGSILAGQKTGNDTLIFMYDNNGDIFGFTYNGTPYYYVKNAQNDVFLIVNEDCQAVVLYQYDAWGKVTACYDVTDFGLGSINPIMYRSYYVDLEMGMFIYYLNSRYYIADWGRFASADAYVQTGQGMLDKNMFAYCMNNPVNFVDPSGCSLEYIITIPAEGNGPVTVTKDNGKTYEYNAPKEGDTYYFVPSDFERDVIDKKVSEILEPILQVANEFLADGIIDSILSGINSINLTYLIPYGNELNILSSKFGLFSIVSTLGQFIWDYEKYGNDIETYALSIAITVGFTAASVATGMMIAASGLGVGTTLVVSLAFSLVLSKAEDETRNWLLE